MAFTGMCSGNAAIALWPLSAVPCDVNSQGMRFLFAWIASFSAPLALAK